MAKKTAFMTYVVLLRGINVGGNNPVPMTELRAYLETLGFTSVTTYIASGNVILKSDRSPKDIRHTLETGLPKRFSLSGDAIKTHVLDHMRFKAVIDKKPKGFGESPTLYHSDVIFLMDMTAEDAFPAFDPKEGVDRIWKGDGVIYSQRLSAQRTKSRLNKVMSSPAYRHMTIRNWNTTTKLLELLAACR